VLGRGKRKDRRRDRREREKGRRERMERWKRNQSYNYNSEFGRRENRKLKTGRSVCERMYRHALLYCRPQGAQKRQERGERRVQPLSPPADAQEGERRVVVIDRAELVKKISKRE
jgi:hypothetical protein